MSADPRSLEVLEGLRGVKPLTDKDRVEIGKNIDGQGARQPRDPLSLQPRAGPARQTAGSRSRASSRCAGAARPLTAQVTVEDDGAVRATIPVTQSGWGIKPYRGLMGALKVRDEVEVVIAANLPSG